MSLARVIEPVTALDRMLVDNSSSRVEATDIGLVKKDSSIAAESSDSIVLGFESFLEERDTEMVKAPTSAVRNTSGWAEIKQSWEGRVVENHPDTREFVAVISDRTCRANPDEEVVIGYESVIESDVRLISEGAVFFWNIGTYRKLSPASGKIGPATNKYELRFRRLPPLSRDTIEEIKQLSKGLSNIIHGH
ncbi:hypothetical protein ACF8LH_13135 [Pseudomonas sp. zbq_4]|uniref:hypothetical protein n=1 Tax=Pseudomonas sp. zbq_4 TaxID=3367240 RepID=UPI00370C0B2A